MKKFICIILAIMCAFCLFARDKHITTTEEGRLAEDLLDDGLYRNKEEILSIVPVLTPAEISLLYNKNKAGPAKDAVMNGLIGFGAGSFNLGDRKGGWIQVGLEAGGLIVGGTSFIYFIGSMLVGIVTLGTYDDLGAMFGSSAIGTFAGLGVFLAGRIYGIVRGIKYPKQYNQDLQETLYGTTQSGPQISFAPVIAPQGIGVGFGVGVSF